MKMAAEMDETLFLLKALSDQSRLRIFSSLQTHPELCACQITEFLQVSGATVSRHLSIMVQAGILKNRKSGRWVYFRLNRENHSLEPLFQWVTKQLKSAPSIMADQQKINQITRIPCEELCRKQRGSNQQKRM